MAAALQDMGFEPVRTRFDTSQEQLAAAVDEFARDIRSGDSALLYYAGHAMQIDGLNYLIPVDFAAGSEFGAKIHTVNLDLVLKAMDAARVKILILDACRTNPYASFRGANGLAEVQKGEGTYIAFAAAPGQSASDSPEASHGLFTNHLLEVLQEPGLTIDGVFNRVRDRVFQASQHHQFPWSTSGLVGDFVFRPNVGPEPRQILADVVSSFTEISVLDHQMRAAQKTGQSGLAIFLGKKAVNSCQRIRGELRPVDVEMERTYRQYFEDTYQTLANIMIESNRPGDSQAVLALLGEALAGVRDEARIAQLSHGIELTPDEVEFEKKNPTGIEDLMELGKRLMRLEHMSQWRTARNQELSDGIIADARVMDTDIRQLGADLEKQLPRPTEIGAGEIAAVRGVLARLGSGAVAIYTLLTDAKYVALLVGPSGEKTYEYSIRRADLNRKIFEFRLALEDPRADPKLKAQELYAILVRPLEDDLKSAKAETLLWSLDGALRYVPLGALHDGHAYLTERYRMSILTPATLTGMTDKPGSEHRPIIFGVTQGHEGFTALPGVAEEAKRIQAISGGKILLDTAFTASSLQAELRSSHYPVVHIASHFVFRPGRADQSFLLLGDGAHLSMAEMMEWPRLFSGVDLLVLSGSDTSLDGISDGREVEGFSNIAIRQGARAVLGSLWSVADESTTAFMGAFYSKLASGSTKADALRGAQLELMSDPRYAHPYYWASYVLTGNPL
jgi:CHAT domain-containing protein